MAIRLVSKQAKAGASLDVMETQGINAINQLKAIKINMAALKTAINSDDDYTAEDVAEVQAVIDTLIMKIATI